MTDLDRGELSRAATQLNGHGSFEPFTVDVTRNQDLEALRDRVVAIYGCAGGERVGDEIRCGYHGLRFAGDGICTTPSRLLARAYPGIATYSVSQSKSGPIWTWSPSMVHFFVAAIRGSRPPARALCDRRSSES